MKKYKVLIIASYAESIINFRGPMIKAIISRGHDVVVCAPCDNITTIKLIEELGANFYHVPLQRTGINPLKDIGYVIKLTQMFNKIQPDKILSYTHKPVIFSSIAARIAGIDCTACMITGLGYAFTEDGVKQRIIRFILILLFKMSLKNYKIIFFQNNDDLELFKKKGLIGTKSHPIIINGSGIDLKHFNKTALPGNVVFLLISRLLKEKGVYEYVNAARKIKKINPDTIFLLVGYIDENPSSIKNNELNSWVDEGVIEYLGRIDDVRQVISRCSVYVLPSYYREGTPRTILEAMAMGRPIITTNSPGCKETVVDGKNGILVPIKDINELQIAMEYFLDHQNIIQEMGDESYKLAKNKYDVNKVNKVIIDNMGL